MNDTANASVAETLRQLDDAWAALQAFIASVTPEQMTDLTDDAGWTVKDHLIHIVVWQDGILALLDHESRRDRMGLDEVTWRNRDFDAMNAVIQHQHRARSLDDVLSTLERTHQAFRARIAAMSDADLLRPYADFQAGSDNQDPILGWLQADGAEHYLEHIPWMQAITRSA